ncbi:MAG TPA: signal peptide peptidase SppA [Coriobacteriia bacterium]|jgi:protease-4
MESSTPVPEDRPQQAGGYAPPQAPYPTGGGYVPREGGRRTGWIVAAAVIVVLLLTLGGCCAALASIGSRPGGGAAITGNNGIALIHLDGTIQDSGASATGADPVRLIRLLKKADADTHIKAVLLRINSPGGTVSASQEIAMQVARMKKPVVADIGDTGASGAYYIASQSDEIVATPSSAVGSIGVVLTVPNVEELMKKLGIKVTSIHEGTFKDAGSPFRSVTPTETAMLKADIKPAYDQFIADVARGRKLPEAKVREMATGWVWPGVVAKDMGLVDKLGNYSDAVDEAARLGKVSGRPEVVDYDQTDVFGVLSRLAGAAERLGAPSAATDVLKGTVPR